MANVNMEQVPYLVSSKPLKSEFKDVHKIFLTSNEFTLGRGTKNAVIIPYPSISRNHCVFRNIKDSEWIIEDNSTFGIQINGNKLGKGSKRKLSHNDIISLEPCSEFIYKYIIPSEDDFEIPNKRFKMDTAKSDKNIVTNMKIKFEESQSFELKHIEDKIQNTQQILSTSKNLKDQLQNDMNRKIQQLESCFAQQIENLKGERNEVEKQKLLLIQERDVQLTSVKKEMEGKIIELKEQIDKHNTTESELLAENSSLKEKLVKEREEFLSELSKESSSKQDMLEKLEAKICEQEEVRLKEKHEFEEMLRKETEELRLAKEKELRELAEEKQLHEIELRKELDNIKKNLQEQVKQTDQQRLKAEQELNEQIVQMKKQNDLEKVKMDQLIQEREVIQIKLSKAQETAAKSLEDLKAQVTVRETELAVLAAQRIQQQVEQSSEVIQNLQDQLEKVKNQLQNVENEKSTLIENMVTRDTVGERSSKQTVLTEVGELMESELQCSICAELFVEATTLNCSHTFCKYCITKWKKKKKECPICRGKITTECRSLVLDSFIEKMVHNLTEELRIKREEMLKSRQELISHLTPQRNEGMSRNYYNASYDSSETEEEDSDDGVEFRVYDRQRSQFFDSSYSHSRSDSDTDDDEHDNRTSSNNSTYADYTDEEGNNSNDTRSQYIVGRPGVYYGGYGRCFICGARGHWATGCPLI